MATGERVERVRWSALTGRARVHALQERVGELEADVAELRAQSLRLAELTDVVEKLLIPMASRDQEGIDAAIAEFRKGL